MKKQEKNITQEAPILFGIEKKNVFKVPENYFENLPSSLLEIASTKPQKVISLKQWLVYTTSIAAVLVVGFFGLVQYQNQQEIKQFNQNFNQLSAYNYEEEFFEDDLLQLPVKFDEDNELDIMLYELDQPTENITIYKEDINDFFKSDEDIIN